MERVITLQRLKYFELELLRMPCMPYKFSHFLKNYIAKLVLCLFRTGSQHSGEETCTSCHTRSNRGEQLTEKHWTCTAPPGASKKLWVRGASPFLFPSLLAYLVGWLFLKVQIINVGVQPCQHSKSILFSCSQFAIFIKTIMAHEPHF